MHSFPYLPLFLSLGRSIDMVVDAILQLFQQRTNDALASEISKIKHKHSEDDGDTKGNLGTGLMASLKEANSNLLLEEQGNGENQAMVDMIGRLVNLLLVFPLEYYAKHQRKSVVWLCFLADAWLWSNGRANMGSLLRGSLACRSVGLRFVHVVNAGILVSRGRGDSMERRCMTDLFSYSSKQTLPFCNGG